MSEEINYSLYRPFVVHDEVINLKTTEIAQWRSATSLDANSVVNVDPLFWCPEAASPKATD